MRNLLLKMLILVCVIVGLGALSQCFYSEEEPSGGSGASSSTNGERVTQIELSDDELIF